MDYSLATLEHRLAEALERAQPHSDIDVAVYVDTQIAPSAYGYAAELTAHLMQALETDAIDVVVLNQAPPLLYHRVLRDGSRILSRDIRATTTREGYALSQYCDGAARASATSGGASTTCSDRRPRPSASPMPSSGRK